MKGQAFSLDFLVSLMVFFGVIAVIMYFILILPSGSSNALAQKAFSASDILVNRLLGNQNVLDCALVKELKDLAQSDYQAFQGKLAVAEDAAVSFTENICDTQGFGRANSTARNVACAGRIVFAEKQIIRTEVCLYA